MSTDSRPRFAAMPEALERRLHDELHQQYPARVPCRYCDEEVKAVQPTAPQFTDDQVVDLRDRLSPHFVSSHDSYLAAKMTWEQRNAYLDEKIRTILGFVLPAPPTTVPPCNNCEATTYTCGGCGTLMEAGR